MTAATPMSSVPSAAWHGVYRSDSTLPAKSRYSLPPERRGRLKNGNRSGDFLGAPRCGARTRCGGECRQPAMPNGRCRLHGGLSTGPRTPEGLARSRRARWKHGARSAEVRALRRAARTQLRRVRTILSRAYLSAGHGVHRSNSVTTSSTPIAKTNHRGHRGSQPSARAAHHHPSPVSSVVNPSSPSAGHGVHRSNSQPNPVGIRPRSPAAKSSSPAWHGVLRSFRNRLRASASFSAIGAVLRSPAPTNR
jgi:hypothetical protein